MKCAAAVLQSSFCPNHRSIFIPFLIFVLNVYTSKAASREVSCDYITDCFLIAFFGQQMTCYMKDVTIDSQGFTIASPPKDETVTAMGFFSNKNALFLPDNIHEAFPYLMTLSASSCSIKTVSKENLKNLNKLRGLYLDNNQIKTIRSNVFEDLTSLQRLDLGKITLLYFLHSIIFSCLDRNQIKSINVQAFQHLKKLTNVWLNYNECTRKNFTNSDEINKLKEVVTQNCAFTEINGVVSLLPHLKILILATLAVMFLHLPSF